MNSRAPQRTTQWPHYRRILVAAVGLCLGAQVAVGQAPVDTTPRLTISGFGQADFIVDFKRNDPLWFDVNRPSRLPSGPDQFGGDGNTYVSARQSRFGVLAHLPTRRGEMMAQFSFDMFGVGPDAGQTTIRLRHAWGKWHHFGGGLLESPFMDVDVFPNILEYWGPNGMLFFRNAQIFWEPIDSGKANLRIALERPGASADVSNFADRIELQNVKPHYPLPDLSAGYKYGGKWGYVRLSGMLRDIRWVQGVHVPLDAEARPRVHELGDLLRAPAGAEVAQRGPDPDRRRPDAGALELQRQAPRRDLDRGLRRAVPQQSRPRRADGVR